MPYSFKNRRCTRSSQVSYRGTLCLSRKSTKVNPHKPTKHMTLRSLLHLHSYSNVCLPHHAIRFP
ncbi:hypothetical protein HanXRQr2_Chr10g0452051 [Helianthus annuus]|uniref:Uncharacterized protein n=1 Tax=Helianthus annuus TaxID=4232 RepID=A0A9K3HZW6_HELAN|nr:hypothetical protein HanXRQr2_Chr10g0452051 [Helianthus annuus]